VKRLSRSQVLAGVVLVVAIGAIAAGLFALGSPADERARRLDQKRVDDLSQIAEAIDSYWTQQGRLPASVQDLERERGFEIPAADPVTNQPYEYRVTKNRFELCAVFERPSESGRTFWSHGAGRRCFEREPTKKPF
jgi:hypothetical protein